MRNLQVVTQRLRTVLVNICCPMAIPLPTVTRETNLTVHACAAFTFGNGVWREQWELCWPVWLPGIPVQVPIYQWTKDLALNSSALTLRDMLVDGPEADSILVEPQDLCHHVRQLAESEAAERVWCHDEMIVKCES